METSLLGLALGAVVGAILALTGAGGGILAVPLLVFGLQLSIMQAAPVGLIAVGLASAIGAVLGLREGIVRYRAAALIGGVGMALAPAGIWLAGRIPDEPLTIAFSLVLAWVALRMYRQAGRGEGEDGADAGKLPCALDPDDGRLVWTLPCAWAMAGTGAVSGVLSGLLGVGGGFVIVPALNRFTNLATRSIVATSLAVIALVSVGGVAAAAAKGSVEWRVALPFAGGAVMALLVGRGVAERLAGPRLKRTFAVTSAIVAVLLIARALGWIEG